jgi:plasmid maintenance system killer protein
VEIEFSDEGGRELYCCKVNLTKRFGADVAGKICCRLSMLGAAPSLEDVPTSPPIRLSADGHGIYSVALGPSHRLMFKTAPTKPARSAAPSSVSKIEIIGPAPVPAAREKTK